MPKLFSAPRVYSIGSSNGLLCRVQSRSTSGAGALRGGFMTTLYRILSVLTLSALMSTPVLRAQDDQSYDAQTDQQYDQNRSEEHTSELQSQSISYAVFCLKKKKKHVSSYEALALYIDVHVAAELQSVLGRVIDHSLRGLPFVLA